MARQILALLLLWCACGALGHVSIPLTRTVPVFVAGDEYSAINGRSVPLGGGYLTWGGYTTELEIGNPPQKFGVQVDAGSSNLALAGPGCTTCGKVKHYCISCSSTATVLPCNSSLCQQCNLPPVTNATSVDFYTSANCPGVGGDGCLFGEPFCFDPDGKTCGYGVVYGSGFLYITGYYIQDTVCLGGMCASATVGMTMAEDPEGEFSGGISGILGLASEFNACNPSCVPPLLDEYVASSQMENVFGMCLTPTTGGTLDLGYFNDTKYSGELQWAPMNTDRWYTVGIVDVRVGNYSLELPPFIYQTTNDVVGSFVDSGTLIIITNVLVHKHLLRVFRTHFCDLPFVCDNHHNKSLFAKSCIESAEVTKYLPDYPNVTFVVTGEQPGQLLELHVPPQSYLMDRGNDTYCFSIAAIPGTGVVLGEIFMANYYVAFDRQNHRMGFAPQVPGGCL